MTVALGSVWDENKGEDFQPRLLCPVFRYKTDLVLLLLIYGFAL